MIGAFTLLVKLFRQSPTRRNKPADSCLDTPYDTVKEAQDWWKSVDLPERVKEAVARENAIRLFKLPLSL
jgi:hypothetical protein